MSLSDLGLGRKGRLVERLCGFSGLDLSLGLTFPLGQFCGSNLSMRFFFWENSRKICGSQIQLDSKWEQFMVWKWLFHQLEHHLGFVEWPVRSCSHKCWRAVVFGPLGQTQSRKELVWILYKRVISPFLVLFHKEIFVLQWEVGGKRVDCTSEVIFGEQRWLWPSGNTFCSVFLIHRLAASLILNTFT